MYHFTEAEGAHKSQFKKAKRYLSNWSHSKQQDLYQIYILFVPTFVLERRTGLGWVGMGVWDWGSCIRSHRSPFVSEIFNVSRIKNEFLKFVKFGCNEIF